MASSVQARSILLYCAGVFFLTLQDAAAKWLTQHYPVNEIVFLRACFALIVIAAFVAAKRNVGSLKTARLGQQILRGVLIAATVYLSILGLEVLPLASALSLSYTAPLFLTMFSAWLLAERVSMGKWIAVVLGFAGALVILGPMPRGFDVAGLYILASALTYALAVIMTRRLLHTESMLSIITYGIVTTAVLSGATLPAAFVMPSMAHLPVFAALGLGGALSTALFVFALRTSEVSTVAPLDFTGLVWGVLVGFMIWQDIPSLWTCLGPPSSSASASISIGRAAAAASGRIGHLYGVGGAARRRLVGALVDLVGGGLHGLGMGQRLDQAVEALLQRRFRDLLQQTHRPRGLQRQWRRLILIVGLQQLVEETAGGNAQEAADHQEGARRDPVGPLFVFLYLLVGDTDAFRQLGQRQALFRAQTSDFCA